MKRNHNLRESIFSSLTGTRLVVAAFGILCGLTGIIAGFFEILQGNSKPESIVISTIGSEYIMYEDFTYYAITIIPNFLVSGVLAIITSSLVILWSMKYVQRKNGALILLALSAAQMLVGGGWVIDLGVISSVLATRIGKPLNWWRRNLPYNVRIWLVRLFPFSLISYVLISLSMLVLTIIGVNNEALIKFLEPLAVAMFVPILLLIFGGLAYDIQNNPER